MRCLVSLVALVAALVAVPVAAAQGDPVPPLRVAAYYPWFPEGWSHLNLHPFTHFRPSLGYYDASDRRVIRRHLASLRWGGFNGALYSWWGRGSATDRRLPLYLAAARRKPPRFAVYHEPEGYTDPTVEELRADLEHIRDRYATSPAYLRVDGRFVVFAYGDADDGGGCEAAERWAAANTVGAYVVLRAHHGYRRCPRQPDGWHRYSLDRDFYNVPPYSFTISPGFHDARELLPRRPRDLRRWRASIRRMVASGATFQLVISFNEWGEGTAVESAREWATPSGHGAYLDALHRIR